MGEYAASLKLAQRQTDQLERKVMELHQKREPGQSPQIAMDEFLAIARGLETYGGDMHPVKDHCGTQLYLGINYTGINTFASLKRTQHFRWPEVHKLNYEGKMFIAHLSYTDRESREPVTLRRVYFKQLFHSRFPSRKSTPSDSSVPQDRLAVTYGVVPSNKCSFSRKQPLEQRLGIELTAIPLQIAKQPECLGYEWWWLHAQHEVPLHGSN